MTAYFEAIRGKPDRISIEDAWILRTANAPLRRSVQRDGRIQCWGQIPEMENRYIRVILLPDGETVHNAFFDRRFKP
jgi:hypothetical protein